jgi:hypothetical protein
MMMMILIFDVSEVLNLILEMIQVMIEVMVQVMMEEMIDLILEVIQFSHGVWLFCFFQFLCQRKQYENASSSKIQLLL